LTEPRSIGDRRASGRLGVVGSLWATFETSEPARLVNVGRNGALIASRTPYSADVARVVTFKLGHSGVTLDGLIRHVRPAADEGGTVYYIGVEFVSDREVILRAMTELGVSVSEL
jgi:hypothetical protein